MTTQPEIKAGQRWESNGTGYSLKYVVVVLFADPYVVLVCDGGAYRRTLNIDDFLACFFIAPKPKTRHVTADDIMKMLAANPVLFYKGEHNTSWWLLRSPQELPPDTSTTIYSPNPFAANPVIVGPMVTDEVGE